MTVLSIIYQWGDLQWHNTHTQFYESQSTGSKTEVGHTDAAQ
jgi:hypothetical protein